MYKTRYLNVIIGFTLILAVFAAFQVFRTSNGSTIRSQQPVGMGDLRRYEAQSSLPLNNNEAILTYAGGGDGDNHGSVAFQLLHVTGKPKDSPSRNGMGDLHLIEASQLKNGLRYTGMGDLHLLDPR